MMTRGDTGPAVIALQQALLELGYGLPRWGADGELGSETLDALALFLRDHGVNVDDDTDEVSDEELDKLDRALGSARASTFGPRVAPGTFHDVRAIAAQQRVGGRRAWARIDGITLHQTACVFGERPARWRNVAAHIGVTRGGQVVWMHDFEKVVWHGNGFNGATVGIEMEGTYAGVHGDERTFWRPPTQPDLRPQEPTPALVQAAHAAARWVCAEVARHGGKVRHLYAHRQASRTRQSDPGSLLWQQVALPLLADAGLALDTGGPGFKLGAGRAIPEAWDTRCGGVPY